jgi:hypothetical protein
MKHFIALAICLLICTAAPAAEQLIGCGDSRLPLKFRAPPKDFSGELPIPDYLETLTACHAELPWLAATPATPAPRSAWRDSERSLYQEALAKRPADILVVPFQVQGYGLDRIERALMSADLAYALGDASGHTVADPFLVARALGEGSRRLAPGEAERLARRIGATRIITGYVGHDLHHTFTLTLQEHDVTSATVAPVGKVAWQHDWRSVTFTDERMPALVFHDLLPEVVRALPLSPAADPRTDTQLTSAAGLRIAQTPQQLVSTDAVPNTVSPAAALDLLGALGALHSELSRERAFERAFLFTLRAGHRDSNSRFLAAYALTQLWRRPAALATLHDQTSSEAIALTAILDGDLPAAQKAVARVPQSLQRVLLDIGLRDLEAAYRRKLASVPRASEQTFGTSRASWEPFIQLRAMDPDRWAVPDGLVVKTLLDQSFPVGGLDAKSLIQGSAVARGTTPDEVDLDLANERHLRRIAAQLDPTACCKTRELRPTRWDLLWLLEGLSEGRITKSLERETTLQALAEPAWEAIGRYEPLLSGKPTFELSRSIVALALYHKSADDVRASWRSQLEQGATAAAHYAPGENAVAYGALQALGMPSPESSIMVDAYGYDYPRRPFWPMWFIGIEANAPRTIALALEALAFSANDPEPIASLPPGKEAGHMDAVIASLGSRFTGSSLKPSERVADLSNEPLQLRARLEQAIKSDPDVWENYASLGEFLITSGGKYTDARDAFLRYPGFKEPRPNDPVAVSKYAYTAGSLLFWQGVPALARPLYQISAGLHTGSAASLSSEARLLMLDGDYAKAAAAQLERATRYDDANAYRDYLSFLHAFGHSEQAWQGFSQVSSLSALPQTWLSALVGQQMQGLRDAELRAWLMQREIRDAHFRAARFAPYYAVLWYSTEHVPPADLGKLVEQLDGPPVAKIDTDGRALLVPSSETEGNFQIIWPSQFRRGKAPPLPPDTLVKSQLAYFADAYAALRLGDYEAAVNRFVIMADRYPIEGYPLAFFAYAAAKTGDKVQLEQFLEPRKANSEFDYWLAKAYFAAARQDRDGAVSALHTAFRLRPNTDYRPVMTEYQYAQACEWLFKDTGDARFSAALLDWAQKYQALAPTQAWAYAVEYAYEKPGFERTRALALALYLDPSSERISSASKTEVTAAQTWLQEHNPFRIPKSGGGDAAAQTAMSASPHPAYATLSWR